MSPTSPSQQHLIGAPRPSRTRSLPAGLSTPPNRTRTFATVPAGSPTSPTSSELPAIAERLHMKTNAQADVSPSGYSTMNDVEGAGGKGGGATQVHSSQKRQAFPSPLHSSPSTTLVGITAAAATGTETALERSAGRRAGGLGRAATLNAAGLPGASTDLGHHPSARTSVVSSSPTYNRSSLKTPVSNTRPQDREHNPPSATSPRRSPSVHDTSSPQRYRDSGIGKGSSTTSIEALPSTASPVSAYTASSSPEGLPSVDRDKGLLNHRDVGTAAGLGYLPVASTPLLNQSPHSRAHILPLLPGVQPSVQVGPAGISPPKRV